MDFDTDSTVTVFSLLQSFPSLKRIPDKERVSSKAMMDGQSISLSLIRRSNVFGLNMKCQRVLTPWWNTFRERSINRRWRRWTKPIPLSNFARFSSQVPRRITSECWIGLCKVQCNVTFPKQKSTVLQIDLATHQQGTASHYETHRRKTIQTSVSPLWVFDGRFSTIGDRLRFVS